MRIIASAPGRCGILGNPTDMYGGSVISCTTQERAVCVLTPGDRLAVRVAGQDFAVGEGDDLRDRGDYGDLARAVLRGMGVTSAAGSFSLDITTDIPMQAGLSGSTALVCAIYGAVSAFLGRTNTLYDTAEAIRRIEYEQMRVICGFQDQYMTVFGGLNYLDFRDKGSHLAADNQPLATVEPLAHLLPAELPFLLANTGVKHHSGAAHKPVRERWLDGDEAVVGGYERLARLARDAKRDLLRGDWNALARAMNANMQIQQSLGASGGACDRLAEVARASGSLAAKLAGAGQGGTILALTFEPERTAAALQETGATRILYPRPSPGLTVEVHP